MWSDIASVFFRKKISGADAEENRVGDDGLVQDLDQATRQLGGRRENQGIKASLAWAEAASAMPMAQQAHGCYAYVMCVCVCAMYIICVYRHVDDTY